MIFSFLVDDYYSAAGSSTGSRPASPSRPSSPSAQTLVIITRNIDLSVGSIVGVTAYLTGEFAAAHHGASPALAIALAIGDRRRARHDQRDVLVAYGRVPAIIVTLGTLAIYRSWLVSHARRQDHHGRLPAGVDRRPAHPHGVPASAAWTSGCVVAVVIVIVAVLQVALARLRWGRRLYAIGSNPEAAVQTGLPTRRLVLGAFVACGALSGLAGFLFLARFGTITVVAGQGLELDSVAAAVVGGVSVLGGSGTLVGAFLGAVLIDMLDQSLVRVPQVSEFWRDAILGALILAAVVADVAIGRRFQRRWSAEARPHTRLDDGDGDDPGDGPRRRAGPDRGGPRRRGDRCLVGRTGAGSCCWR